jgi:hypothetical protein
LKSIKQLEIFLVGGGSALVRGTPVDKLSKKKLGPVKKFLNSISMPLEVENIIDHLKFKVWG